jgi:hypothetical protein
MLGAASIGPPAVVPEALSGWRTWGLVGSRDAASLGLVPVVRRRSRVWPAARPTRAVCARGRRHRVPDVGCRCGLHALRDTGSLRRTRDPAVVGTVALWGRIVEHEYGYRAEWAYPQRLRLICRLCFWQWGVTGSAEPSIVVRRRGGELVPLCAEHVEVSRRYGFAVPNGPDAGDIERALLDLYGVDVLRAV